MRACQYLYIAGSISGAGKSSICAALLAKLLRDGYPAETLAYIKPVTQCLEPQMVAGFCQAKAIEAMPIGPVILSKPLLKQCYQEDNSLAKSLLSKAAFAIKKISHEKLYCLVDGVGYPGVGSIAGVSNGEVAKAINASVILVCNKTSPGDAIDTVDWMYHYFLAKHVKVIGIVFNQLPLNCYKKYVKKIQQYYQNNKTNLLLMAMIPQLKQVTIEQLSQYIDCSRLK